MRSAAAKSAGSARRGKRSGGAGWMPSALGVHPAEWMPSARTLDDNGRNGTNIARAALHGQPARLGPPLQPFLLRQGVKEVLGKTAAIIVAGAEKEYLFHRGYHKTGRRMCQNETVKEQHSLPRRMDVSSVTETGTPSACRKFSLKLATVHSQKLGATTSPNRTRSQPH